MNEINDIRRQVCAKYGITLDQMLGEKRSRYLVRARMEAILRLRYERRLGVVSIARIMNRDHTSVLHALRTAKQYGVDHEQWFLHQKVKDVLAVLKDADLPSLISDLEEVDQVLTGQIGETIRSVDLAATMSEEAMRSFLEDVIEIDADQPDALDQLRDVQLRVRSLMEADKKKIRDNEQANNDTHSSGADDEHD